MPSARIRSRGALFFAVTFAVGNRPVIVNQDWEKERGKGVNIRARTNRVSQVKNDRGFLSQRNERRSSPKIQPSGRTMPPFCITKHSTGTNRPSYRDRFHEIFKFSILLQKKNRKIMILIGGNTWLLVSCLMLMPRSLKIVYC